MMLYINQTVLSAVLFSISFATFADKLDIDKAIKVKPNIERGEIIYQKNCVKCHHETGWANESYISKQRKPGAIPTIAGQHKNVLIKQLIDIRNGQRDNPIMYPYTLSEYLKNEAEIADVSAYISQLPMATNNKQGNTAQLSLGKTLFNKSCKNCHGEKAEGNNQKFIPILQKQEYNYLLRQFVMIRDHRRTNTDAKMIKVFSSMSNTEKTAVIDFISRITP